MQASPAHKGITFGMKLQPKLIFSWLMPLIIVLAAVAAWRWLPVPSEPSSDAVASAARPITGRDPSSPSAETPPPFAPPINPQTDRERLIAAACSMRDIPYEWGAKGPDHYDCSGFTKAAYRAVGIQLPDGSFNQAEGEQPFGSPDELSAGDLLFYRWPGKQGVSHVTMYAGDGWVIGTGTPGQPMKVTVYPLLNDLPTDGTVITFRHIRLADE